MDDYRISEKLPKNAKNMVTDPTAPAILLGFAGSDPEFWRIVNFQRLAEKGVSPYSDFWEFIRNAAKNIDCQTQKSGFENNQSFKDNYKKGCSICYMRTAGHGLSVNGAVVIGTAGGNTFTISNVRTSEK
jgi:hypothetical protein